MLHETLFLQRSKKSVQSQQYRHGSDRQFEGEGYRAKEGPKRGGQTEAKRKRNRLIERYVERHTKAIKSRTCNEKHLGRQAAGQQWPNDVVLRPHRKIPGTHPRDRLCHRRGQRAAADVSMTSLSLSVLV